MSKPKASKIDKAEDYFCGLKLLKIKIILDVKHRDEKCN